MDEHTNQDPSAMLPIIQDQIRALGIALTQVTTIIQEILNEDNSRGACTPITNISEAFQIAYGKAKDITETWKQVNSIKTKWDNEKLKLEGERAAVQSTKQELGKKSLRLDGEHKKKLEDLESDFRKRTDACDALRVIWENGANEIPSKLEEFMKKIDAFGETHPKIISDSTTLQENYRLLDGYHSQLKNSLVDFQKKLDSAASKSSTLEETKRSQSEMITSLQGEIENLRLGYDKDLRGFQQEFDILDDSNQSLRQKAGADEREIFRLQTDAGNNSSEISKLREQAQQQEEELTRLGGQAKNDKEELETLRNKSKNDDSELEILRTQKNNESSELRELRKKKDEWEKTREDILTEKRGWVTEEPILRSKISRLEAERDNLKKQIEASPPKTAPRVAFELTSPGTESQSQGGQRSLKRKAEALAAQPETPAKEPNLLADTDRIKEVWRDVNKQVHKHMGQLRPFEPCDFAVARYEIARCFGNSLKHPRNYQEYLDKDTTRQGNWKCLQTICNNGHTFAPTLQEGGKNCDTCKYASSDWCVRIKEEHQRLWFRLVRVDKFD